MTEFFKLVFRPLVRRFRQALMERGYLHLRDRTLKAGVLPVHLAYIINKYAVDCILDVGANQGQFAGFLRARVMYKGPILSFEPGSVAFAKLEKIAERESGITPYKCALGSVEGELELNIMEQDVLSSFHKPLDTKIKMTTNRVVSVEKVPVHTLDHIIDESDIARNAQRIFLKIDTQGFDLEVLKGLSTHLDKCIGIMIETPFIRIYDHSPTYKDIFDALEQKGFSVAAFAPSGVADDRIIDMDCIFLRNPQVSGA